MLPSAIEADDGQDGLHGATPKLPARGRPGGPAGVVDGSPRRGRIADARSGAAAPRKLVFHQPAGTEADKPGGQGPCSGPAGRPTPRRRPDPGPQDRAPRDPRLRGPGWRSHEGAEVHLAPGRPGWAGRLAGRRLARRRSMQEPGRPVGPGPPSCGRTTRSATVPAGPPSWAGAWRTSTRFPLQLGRRSRAVGPAETSTTRGQRPWDADDLHRPQGRRPIGASGALAAPAARTGTGRPGSLGCTGGGPGTPRVRLRSRSTPRPSRGFAAARRRESVAARAREGRPRALDGTARRPDRPGVRAAVPRTWSSNGRPPARAHGLAGPPRNVSFPGLRGGDSLPCSSSTPPRGNRSGLGPARPARRAVGAAEPMCLNRDGRPPGGRGPRRFAAVLSLWATRRRKSEHRHALADA